MRSTPPRSSGDSISDRRVDKLAVTSATYSFGAVTSTRMTGSRSTGFAFLAASWNAMEPAILKADSDESMSWYEPSYNTTRTSST